MKLDPKRNVMLPQAILFLKKFQNDTNFQCITSIQTSILRMTVFVLRFIDYFITKWGSEAQKKKMKINSTSNMQKDLALKDEELDRASNYFFRKATDEVKKFVKEDKYMYISSEKNGILYYTGRILPDQDINNSLLNLAGVMNDLSKSTFCMPIIDKHSPLAYSIVNEVHWHDPVANHAGVETNLRYTMQYAYILEGRHLVQKMKSGCKRCRYLYKRSVDVAMEPVSSYNLTIAPPFYVCQVDLACPFKAFSVHHRRTTIKIWFTVFCCA